MRDGKIIKGKAQIGKKKIDELFENNKIALEFLENGNSQERNKAITTLVLSKNSQEYYDELFRVFLSDEDYQIRIHALNGCVLIKPLKVFELLEFLDKEQLRIMERYRIKENQYYNFKDSEFLFYDKCKLQIANYICKNRGKFESFKKV